MTSSFSSSDQPSPRIEPLSHCEFCQPDAHIHSHIQGEGQRGGIGSKRGGHTGIRLISVPAEL